MKDRFDGVVQQLLDSGIFLEQAIEVLEKGMNIFSSSPLSNAFE